MSDEVVQATKSAMVDTGGGVRQRIRAGTTTAHVDNPIVQNHPHLWGPLRLDYPAPSPEEQDVLDEQDGQSAQDEHGAQDGQDEQSGPELSTLTGFERREVGRLVESVSPEDLRVATDALNLEVPEDATDEQLAIALVLARRSQMEAPQEPNVAPITDEHPEELTPAEEEGAKALTKANNWDKMAQMSRQFELPAEGTKLEMARAIIRKGRSTLSPEH